ncbi:MAG: sulfatase-like hydrolase/transferase [Pirellulaceae bacterium]
MLPFFAMTQRYRWSLSCHLLHRLTPLAISAAVVFVSQVFLAQISNADQARPNVVLIMADDMGWGDVSFNGNSNLSTPSIDSLARVGARFDRFYVCPVCAPTRAEFLTGRYHPRGGVSGVTEGKERLNLGERTIGEVFKAAGYATAAFGKWHNGTQFPYHPNARGFQEFYGYCSGHWGDYFSPQLERNGELVRGNGYLVDDFTDHALRFIEKNAKQSFFCYLPMPTPHAPMQVPDQYWDRMKDKQLAMHANDGDQEDEDFTRAALAMVECIDFNVGRILRKLDELKLANDTIVVFMTDNGPNSFRWNGGMKGKKGSVDEGGVRSPLFISWPGKIQSGKLILQISGVIDLLPTLAELADVPILGGKTLDGVSLAPLLSGQAGAIPDRMIFSHWNNRVSVRTQQFRLDDKGRLFDMVQDPGQTTDVADRQPAVAAELRSFVNRWKAEMLPKLVASRPFTVGYPEFPTTYLPARDGEPHGAVERSAKAPNCSYFTNWKEPNDHVTWPIEVLEGGNFEVEVHYACPESAVNTVLELSAGDAKTSQAISEAHNPPAIGAEHDRVPRHTESLVKEFKPLKLGRMHLPTGQAELMLSTPLVTGDDGVEVRMVVLRRVR